ncbi:MAG: phenylalanine--tRNA ligase subunit beta [Pseudomonadota bacterium]
MKFSKRWLEEMLGDSVELALLLERLTLAGLEVDGTESLEAIDKLVVGRVITVEPHPDADKLRVCQVDDGHETLQIVCGAPNVRAELRVAVAQIGCKLPGGLKIRKSKLRGVESHGMLCSTAELGLGNDHDGIMELAVDLQPGTPVAQVLAIPDTVVDIDLTPNRGDCFSLLGVAREVATFTRLPFDEPVVAACDADADHPFRAAVAAPEAAPVFTSRVIEGINPDAETPLWMIERLRRSGVRAIHPVVDITNYVMLEYGQPLHGYDLDKLAGNIDVRFASGDESLTLLDGKSITPDSDTLLITDESGAIGLAGIMGGESTSVTDGTRNIVFEAAFFAPAGMAGKARRYGMHTDASLRFERGVDPAGQVRAQERAAALLVAIAGGRCAPIQVVSAPEHVPARTPVTLRVARLEKVLGVAVDHTSVSEVFARLGFEFDVTEDGWSVEPPSFRFDISIEEDLIEEVARVYGYDRIPTIKAYSQTALVPSTESRISEERLRDAMSAIGYSESISYSFVDPDDHAALGLAPAGPELVNPISRELSVMRGTLLCGLLKAAAHNLARQRDSVRMFEFGHVFSDDGEPGKFAAVAVGRFYPEQWGEPGRAIDFFDIKSDLQRMLALSNADDEFTYESFVTESLHPGQAASVLRNGEPIGFIGALHPSVATRFEIDAPCFVFEVDADAAFSAKLSESAPISRFPQVRRDVAVLVDESVAAGDIVATARSAGGALLKAVRVFDVYQGKGIEPGLKSIALGLILLDSSRTLLDEDADRVVHKVIDSLLQIHGAKLRE